MHKETETRDIFASQTSLYFCYTFEKIPISYDNLNSSPSSKASIKRDDNTLFYFFLSFVAINRSFCSTSTHIRHMNYNVQIWSTYLSCNLNGIRKYYHAVVMKGRAIIKVLSIIHHLYLYTFHCRQFYFDFFFIVITFFCKYQPRQVTLPFCKIIMAS